MANGAVPGIDPNDEAGKPRPSSAEGIQQNAYFQQLQEQIRAKSGVGAPPGAAGTPAPPGVGAAGGPAGVGAAAPAAMRPMENVVIQNRSPVGGPPIQPLGLTFDPPGQAPATQQTRQVAAGETVQVAQAQVTVDTVEAETASTAVQATAGRHTTSARTTVATGDQVTITASTTAAQNLENQGGFLQGQQVSTVTETSSSHHQQDGETGSQGGGGGSGGGSGGDRQP